MAQIAYVAPAVNEIPVLALSHTEEICLGIQLQLVGIHLMLFYVGNIVGHITAATYLRATAVFVGISTLILCVHAVHLHADVAVAVYVLAGYLLAVVRGDIYGGKLALGIYDILRLKLLRSLCGILGEKILCLCGGGHLFRYFGTAGKQRCRAKQQGNNGCFDSCIFHSFTTLSQL